MEYLATKLASGKDEAPEVTRWWPRHACFLVNYSHHMVIGENRTLSELRTAMAAMVSEWSRSVTHYGECALETLMAEHTMLEWELTDSAIRSNSARIFAISEDMSKNATAISLVLGASIPRFPERTFNNLLLDHVNIFIHLLHQYLKDDRSGIMKTRKKIMANSVTLGAICTEWLGG